MKTRILFTFLLVAFFSTFLLADANVFAASESDNSTEYVVEENNADNNADNKVDNKFDNGNLLISFGYFEDQEDVNIHSFQHPLYTYTFKDLFFKPPISL